MTTLITAATELVVAPAEELTPAMLVDRAEGAGDLLTCPCCGALNAHDYTIVNILDPHTGTRFRRVVPADGLVDGGEPYSVEECLWVAPEMPDIYHIPSACAWTWECGKCGMRLAEADAPILAPVYTHAAVREAA